MTQHFVTIHATGATLTDIADDAGRQLAAFLAPEPDAIQVATVLVGESEILAEPSARTIDGTAASYVAEVRIRFTSHHLASIAEKFHR